MYGGLASQHLNQHLVGIGTKNYYCYFIFKVKNEFLGAYILQLLLNYSYVLIIKYYTIELE